MAVTIELVSEEIVDAGYRAWRWLLRGDEERLRLLANKHNKNNSEPIKYIFDCEHCPALLLLRETILLEKIDSRITRSESEWQRMRAYDAQKQRGFQYPSELGGTLGGRGSGAIYDETNSLLRVVGFCSAMSAIFRQEIVETTNCS